MLTTLCMKHPGLLDAAILCAVSQASKDRRDKTCLRFFSFCMDSFWVALLFVWHPGLLDVAVLRAEVYSEGRRG